MELIVKLVEATALEIPVGYGLTVNIQHVKDDYKFQFTSFGGLQIIEIPGVPVLKNTSPHERAGNPEA